MTGHLSIDMDVANRFISSLSKSLQALCHGCIEFNSGIEIVGYLNVNIDCGSKVDYVLNEKVQKGHSNSMTFVSNSFLAAQGNCKPVRDGACSPIQELQNTSYPYLSSHKDIFHNQPGSHRAYSQYSYPNSHPVRNPHKRSWCGNGRGQNAPKKHTRHSATHCHNQSAKTGRDSSVANIKAELHDTVEHAEDENDISNSVVENLNVVGGSRFQSQVNQDPCEGDSANNTEPTGDEPYFSQKDNFLHDSSGNETQIFDKSILFRTRPDNKQSTESTHPVNFNVKTNNRCGFSIQNEQDDESEQGMTVSFHQNAAEPFHDSHNAQERQPLCPDQTAPSGEGPGFDVIEIGDEDEDFQAMFGNDRK